MPCRLPEGQEMYGVELCGGSTGGRRGFEPLAGPSVRHRPPDGEEDAELFGAAGVSADEAGQAAEAGRRHRRRDPGGGHGSGRARKQRRPSDFERLRDEHGFTGGYTSYPVSVRKSRSRFCSNRRARPSSPSSPPGHAQVDFGEAVVEVGGRREKVAFFCLILPHSDVWFVKAYPSYDGGLHRLSRRGSALDPL